MKSTFSYFLLLAALTSILSLNGCREPEDEPTPTEMVNVTFSPYYKSELLVLNKVFKSPQDRDIWFTTKKYYLSNVTAVSTSGEKHLIKNITLIDVTGDISQLQVSGSIPVGNYKAISFDLGVRDDLNKADPATYSIDHPLSITQNMYWTWSTQYIFSKLEGKEVNNGDTASFVIHTGTTSLYRPNVSVNRNFEVVVGGTDVDVELDLFTVLSNEDHTFDLVQDGQSHTVDNLDLAVKYMDNFPKGFK